MKIFSFYVFFRSFLSDAYLLVVAKCLPFLLNAPCSFPVPNSFPVSSFPTLLIPIWLRCTHAYLLYIKSVILHTFNLPNYTYLYLTNHFSFLFLLRLRKVFYLPCESDPHDEGTSLAGYLHSSYKNFIETN